MSAAAHFERSLFNDVARASWAPASANFSGCIKVFRVGSGRLPVRRSRPAQRGDYSVIKNEGEVQIASCRVVVSGEVEPFCENGWSEAFDTVLAGQIEAAVGLNGIHRSGLVK